MVSAANPAPPVLSKDRLTLSVAAGLGLAVYPVVLVAVDASSA